MTLVEILKEGTKRCAGMWRGTVLLYAANLILAAGAAFAFRAGMMEVFGSSLMPGKLMQGYDYTTVQELLRWDGGLIAAIRSTLMWFVLLHMLAFAFLGGGIVEGLLGAERRGIRSMLGAGGRFAGRFVRVLLIEVALVVVTVVLLAMVGGAVLGLTFTAARSEMEFIRVLFIVLATGGIVVSILLSIGDYARIILVGEDQHSAFRAVGRSFSFVFRNILRIALLDLIILAATAALIGGGYMIERRTPMSTGWTIVAIFAIHQAALLLRMSVRVWNYSLAITLWRSKHVPAVAVSGATEMIPVPVAPVVAPPPLETVRTIKVTSARKRPAIRRVVKKNESREEQKPPRRGRRKSR